MAPAGGAVLALTLAAVVVAVRGTGRNGWPLWAYRILLSILMVSIPVGIALAHLDRA